MKEKSMSLDDLAREVLVENDRGGFTVPSSDLYPYQWNWDSYFVALGFSTFDSNRAWREIETIFEGQWPCGMVPHILFRSDFSSYFPGPAVWGANKGKWPSTGISQPPVAATVVLEILRSDQEKARELFPKMNAWHQWFHTARDPDGLGIIAMSHPWESGRDNLPDWDKPGDAIDVSNVGEYERRDLALCDSEMRPHKKDYDRYLALIYFGRERGWDHETIARENPFWVADPGTTAILLRAERDLLKVAEILGEDATGIQDRINRMEVGFERLWNKEVGAYCALDLRTNEFSDAVTSASFLAPYAGINTHTAELICRLEEIEQHCEFMVPSFDPRHASFDHLRYWRGPVWAIVNYMIAKGFEEIGQDAWASKLSSSIKELIQKSGFREYFSAIDGSGAGGPSFSWTAAMWLAWVSDSNQAPGQVPDRAMMTGG